MRVVPARRKGDLVGYFAGMPSARVVAGGDTTLVPAPQALDPRTFIQLTVILDGQVPWFRLVPSNDLTSTKPMSTGNPNELRVI